MRHLLSAFIPEKPQTKQRVRVTRNGRFTPKATQAWKARAQHILKAAAREQGLAIPLPKGTALRLDCLLLFPRPKHLGEGGRVRHLVKPDADNVLKSIEDAFDGGGPGESGLIIYDDCEIASVHVEKWYAASGELPGVHVRLWQLDVPPTTVRRNSAGPSQRALACGPHLRWAGGKRQLVPTMLRLLPVGWRGRLIIPFLGGGAFFFALHEAGRLTGEPRAILADASHALINSWRVLQSTPQNLLANLDQHARLHGPEHYEEIRRNFNDRLPFSPLEMTGRELREQAARFLYLNSVCFQGLYRVNKKGRFNGPLAKDRTSTHVLNPERQALLMRNHRALRGASLSPVDFTTTLLEAQAGDLVYADPPYLPLLEGMDTFTAYTAAGFGPADHRVLVDGLRAARQRGALVMISGSNGPLTREIYGDDWHATALTRSGGMSCDGDNRQPAPELLLTSWTPETA